MPPSQIFVYLGVRSDPDTGNFLGDPHHWPLYLSITYSMSNKSFLGVHPSGILCEQRLRVRRAEGDPARNS